MKSWSIPLSLLAATATLSGCFRDSASGEGSGTRVQADVAYERKGDTLIIRNGPDTLRYCGTGTVPVTEIDADRIDTADLELKGDSLSILHRPVALDSHALIRYLSIHTRLGGGSGLIGTWRWRGYAYRVVSGTQTAGEKEAQDKYRDDIEAMLSKFSFTVEFTATRMISSTDQRPADAFLEDWMDGTAGLYSDTAGFAISARAVNATTVELKGLGNGEVVRVILSERNSDFQATSSDPAHGAFAYLEKPVQCPAEDEPAWYGDFLGANSKAP